MIGLFDCNHPIVAVLSLLTLLLSFDDSEGITLQQAARKRRLVHEDQHIERIPIVGLGRRHETEVVWKRHALRQHSLKKINTKLRLEGILVAGALRSFNH